MSRIILRGLLSLSTVILSVAVPAYCQHQYIIQHYTNENGLPANGLKGIELDTVNGFLWVGTQAGLVRFDGRHFTHFGSARNTAIPSRIHFIAKNREGTIFCEEDNFSVYRIIGNNAEWVATDTFLLQYFVNRGGSNPWRPVEQLTNALRTTKRSVYLPHWIVFHDESGDSSSFSFVHFDRTYYYNAAKDSLFEFRDIVNVLKLDGQVYYVGSNLTLWEYNSTLQKLMPVQVTGMPAWDRKGRKKPRFIWAPGMKEPLFLWQQTIWELKGHGSELQLLPLCSACIPPNADVSSVQIWKERGMIFLGSAVNGLYVVKTPFLKSIRSDSTIEAGQAEYAQAEITSGIITTGSGLSFSAQGQLLPGKSRTEFHPRTMYRDLHGDLWFHSGDTIIRYDRQDGRYTRIAVNDGAEKMIFTELRDRLYVFSDIAIAEITGGQYRPLYKFPYEGTKPQNWFNPDAAVELKPGVLAIAAEKLILFDTQKGTAPDTIPIPGLTVKVRALHKYGDYLLIGTYGQGFYVYKDGIVKKMPLDKNGYLSYTHCFMPDAKGFCWISTNHGLFKVSLHALAAAYENNLHEIYYHYFGKDDGMYNTEFNGGCQPCALQLSNGLFSFPSMNGVVIVDPSKQHTPPPAGQVFIDEILADTTSYSFNDSSLQSLPYNAKNLRFRIAVPRFGNAENIYFSYKLEPYNSDWETQDILQNSILQFGGLPPGDYTLYVRVRNGFEPDQFNINKITFHILKPWYQAWWFNVLVLLGIIAIIWSLVNWRTARIEKRKEELQQQVAAQTKQLESQLHQLQDQQIKLEEDNNIKARLIGIISHDMVSPIRFMGFLAKKLRDAQSPDDQSYQTANAFVTVSQELESLTVNMLNWIRFHHNANQMKPERFNLHHLVSESTEIAAVLAKEKGVQLYNDVPEETYITQYRQAIGVIIYNLSMNAMKYTEAGEIRITGRFTGKGFSLMVFDTGIGMPPNMVDQLNSPEPVITEYATTEIKKFQFGYLIIKDLLQLVQGTMTVTSTLNKGTQVVIHLKVA